MNTGWVDASGDSFEYVNASGLPDRDVQPSLREVASKLSDWMRGNQARNGRSNLFQRNKYASPDNPYDQMRVARTAVSDDDIVSSAADATTGLLLQDVRWESEDNAIADVFNQISADIDLDTYLRIVLREEFTESHSTTATQWGQKTYTPRKTRGGKAAARKGYTLTVPTAVRTLDNLSVVPVGGTLFGRTRLAWSASKDEIDAWNSGLHPAMTELFAAQYRPSLSEAAELTELGLNPDQLLEFRPDRVWQHTAVKSSYQRFADIRLKSTFRLLDLKQQLMEADRVNLVGAANYILLVKKGTDTKPATQQEVDNLREGFTSIAKLPVIVSDHRLEIEIITPRTDWTLDSPRYDLLDRRIAARALGALEDSVEGAGGEVKGQINSRMIQRGLESRRLLLRRTVESKIRDAIWNHPANTEALSDVKDGAKPSLAFTPRMIQVDNDAQMIQAVVSARQSKELSRESFLEFLGFDQGVEAERRRNEKANFDDIFQTAVPFNAPANGQQGTGAQGDGQTPPGQMPPMPPAVAGARGGRPAGGGQSPKSVKAVRPRTRSGAPSKS